MMTLRFKWLAIALIIAPLSSYALSVVIGRDIHFPNHYDPAKAAAMRKVIQNGRFQFTGGVVSYWPPDWGTRLSFEGDAVSLSDFLSELRNIPGIDLRLVLYQGRNDELRRDSSWQLEFSQAHPDRLSLHLNLNSTNVDFYKIRFPDWPANKP
jgi:hypothetical protein